jgi:hypothetical protein
MGLRTQLLCAQDARKENDASAKQSIPDEVRFVAAGIQNARMQLHCASAMITSTTQRVKRFSQIMTSGIPVSDLSMGNSDVKTSEWHYQKPNLDITVTPEPGKMGDLRQSRLVMKNGEGTILMKYVPEGNNKTKPFNIARIISKEDIISNGLWAEHASLDPRSYAYQPFGEPLDEVFLKNNNHTTYKGEITFDGSQCMLIESHPTKNMSTLYCIDVQHGFLLRYGQVYITIKDYRFLEMDVQIPHLIGSQGTWLPALIESTFSLPKKSLPGNQDITDPNIAVTMSKTRIVISNFKADCDFPTGTFDMKFPKGTSVINQITGKTYKTPLTDKESKWSTDKNK